MDQATQQNAALVEEMAAAASSLENQAKELVQAVAVFKLGQGQGGVAPSGHRPVPPVRLGQTKSFAQARKAAPKFKPAPKAAALSAPAAVPTARTQAGGDEWESF
jgi:hypothetical protein